MSPTRRAANETLKNSGRQSMDKQQKQQLQQQQQLQKQQTMQLLQVLCETDDSEPDEKELNQLLGSLTEESVSRENPDLETNIDSVDQYERRDTIIVSGPLISEETQQENIKESDINIAHRIGPVHSQRKRPSIVKLSNRALKHDLVGACIQMKP